MNVTTEKRQANETFFRFIPWIMWFLGALFYFYEFLLQVSPSVMVGELMRSFDITAREVGIFGSVYFWTYAPMQIVVGVLLDRFGPHRLLTAAAGACALGTLMFGMTEHFYIALIGRGLTGLGASFAIVGCMKIIANWFPSKRFALMLGLVLTIGMLGAIAGQAPLKLLIEHFADWRKSMYLLAGAGIALMLIMLLVLRDRPDQELTEDHPPADSPHEPGVIEGLAIILTNRQSWLTAIYGGLMFAPTSLFAIWGVRFITLVYDIPELEASTYASLIFVGWAFGSPAVGWFADTIHRRLPSMYIGTTVAFITMCSILYLNLSIPMLLLALFCFGFFSSGFLSAFPIIKEINPPKYNATALGYMNTINMLGGATLPPLIGIILDYYWQGEKINGEPIYSAYDFQVGMTVLPIIILLSFFFIPFIKETYCKPCYQGQDSDESLITNTV